MLEAVLQALQPQADGVYIDATFGRGGHTQALLQQLGPQGRVFGIDQDPQAVAHATRHFANDRRFTIQHGSFDMLSTHSVQWQVDGQVNGILLDLGVSSPQLDDASRGFSFLRDGPLDMRMDNSRGITAQQWLAEADERQLADVFWQYGEERYARRIAKHIVHARQKQPIATTAQLAQLIADALPRKDVNKHPATRVFQAIRIFINRELEALQQALTQSLQVLSSRGRLVVISFHSLEDRMVKRFMREQSQGKVLPRGLPVTDEVTDKQLKVIGKAQKASASEIAENPRSRSAVLRVAEKL